jgi:hypothetical protein
LRTNLSKRLQGRRNLKPVLNFGDEAIGGHDVGEPEIPNRVEHRSGKHRHILCKWKKGKRTVNKPMKCTNRS